MLSCLVVSLRSKAVICTAKAIADMIHFTHTLSTDVRFVRTSLKYLSRTEQVLHVVENGLNL